MSKAAILFTGFCGVALGLLIPTVASAVDIDFENPPYTSGNIIGQEGWSTNQYVLDSGPVNGSVTISTSSPLVGSQSLLYTQTSNDPGDSVFGSDIGVGGVISAHGGVVGADLTVTYKINAESNGISAGTQQAGLYLSHNLSAGASPVFARINGTAIEVFTAGAITPVPGYAYFAGDTLDVTYNIDFDAGTYDVHVVDPFNFSGTLNDLPFGEPFVPEGDGTFLVDVGILARQGTAKIDAISLVQNPFNSLNLSVDRGNGQIILTNPTSGTIDFDEISILSADGALLPGGWLSIAGNYDQGNGVSNDVWTVSSATASDLSEGTTGTGSLTASQEVDLGTGAWLPYYKEDLVLEYFDTATQTTITAPVLFTGTGEFATPFALGDLDFDRDVDGDDWNVFTANALTDTTGMTLAEAYRVSDLNGDLISGGHADFRQFEAAFDAVNGAGSFGRMLAGVPEPASWLLLALGATVLGVVTRGRRGQGRCRQGRCCLPGFAALLAALAFLLGGSGNAQGAVTMVDGFEFYGQNTSIHGQGNWEAQSNDAATGDHEHSRVVMRDGDHALRLVNRDVISQNSFNTVYTSMALPTAFQTGTVYLRWMKSSEGFDVDGNPVDPIVGDMILATNGLATGFDPDGSGFTNDDIPPAQGTPNYDDQQAKMGLWASADGTQAHINNGPGNYEDVDTPFAGNFVHDQWYEMWLHIDNTANQQTRYYVAKDGETPEVILNTAGGEWWDHQDSSFSESTAVKFFHGVSTAFEARVYVDSIGIDATGWSTNSLSLADELPEPLTLEVNTDTGEVAIKNDTAGTLNIDYYEIKSGDGSLNVGVGGWDSLSDQDVDSMGPNPGESWNEAGGSNASHVAEYFLLSDSELLQGESMSLGELFLTSGDTNQLEFNFGFTDLSRSFPGIIERVSGGFLEADFDTDGDVDGNDFLLWQSGFPTEAGATKMNGDFDNDGDVDGNDFLGWQAEFPSPGSGAASAAVPEPSSFVVALVIAVVGAIAWRR